MGDMSKNIVGENSSREPLTPSKGNKKEMDAAMKAVDANVFLAKKKGDPEKTMTQNGNGSAQNKAAHADNLSVMPSGFKLSFDDPELESIYKMYSLRYKQGGMFYCLVMLILLNIASLALSAIYYSSNMQLTHILVMCVFLVLNIVLMVILRVKKIPDHVIIPLLLWFYSSIQLYVDAGLSPHPPSPATHVGWVVTLLFVIYGVFPLRLRWSFLISLLSCIIHSVVVTLIPATQDYGSVLQLPNMVGANLFLFVCANVVGVVLYIRTDLGLRKAFLDTKASLGVQITIEESSKEQERLLLSVLPKHVATEMIKDLGSELTGQFRKVYMNRHENVSILFADIVGFTAMSSKVTPGELIIILNDLFATFDKLATNYRQLRIKILGDCYYCICGCPDPRPDHSVLSVHMGLSMVEAISDVREKTKSGVNMRVGIHTGAILAGVLGQNRWQYDVLGKEVTLANRMESGGVAGRVHISESTAACLSGEFELEPGEGDARDDGIKAAGIKTYLIKSVLKPYPQGTLDEHNRSSSDAPNEENDSTYGIQRKDSKAHLYETLMKRENTVDLSGKISAVSLRFHNDATEVEYNDSRRSGTGIHLTLPPVILLLSTFAQFCVLPKNTLTVVIFIIGEIILIILTVVPLAMTLPKSFPPVLVRMGNAFVRTHFIRCINVLVVCLLLVTVDLVDMFGCETTNSTLLTNGKLDANSAYCDYAIYFPNIASVVILGITVQRQVSYLVRTFLITLVTLSHILIYMVALPALYDRYDDVISNTGSIEELGHSKVVYSVMLIAIAIASAILARLGEEQARQLFYYRLGIEENKQQIDVLRKKNEALIYNILPAHVAKDFIGKRKSDEELYSQTYEETGVMFASCPNFNDHYTEDAINNNGLEWMRFLNEVLSDYDELLNEPRFKYIVKIKTIGPTFMAASGINMEKPFDKDAPTTERWRHLADLVEFALALRETLDRINSQSFNNFMLRIGINHGPLLAGVIGARKPHYDIWGNSVNVSSRMDSTGQLGKIQVVEETMMILKDFGYKFEQRGKVKVKGKGDLMTYFLIGKDDTPLPNQILPYQ